MKEVYCYLEIMIGDSVIAMYTMQFDDIEKLLDGFDIANHEELFELLGEEACNRWEHAESRTGVGIIKE